MQADPHTAMLSSRRGDVLALLDFSTVAGVVLSVKDFLVLPLTPEPTIVGKVRRRDKRTESAHQLGSDDYHVERSTGWKSARVNSTVNYLHFPPSLKYV